MKLICAGYPKTGSKSCSAALREIGFNVADALETIECLGPTWVEYIEGRAKIEDVISKYEQHNFDTNQDLPGNMLWEELYRALPENTKVILTVRDCDETWFQSWSRFGEQEIERAAIWNIDVQNIIMKLATRGWMGPKMEAWIKIMLFVCDRYWYSSWTKIYRVSTRINEMRSKGNKDFMKQCYRKHNLYVIKSVPKENLLIWNIKNGWEPLCNFLGKPIPNSELEIHPSGKIKKGIRSSMDDFSDGFPDGFQDSFPDEFLTLPSSTNPSRQQNRRFEICST